MKGELVELVALAMCNAEQRQLDCPEIESMEDFRLEADANTYSMLAQAAIGVVLDAAAEKVAGMATDADIRLENIIRAAKRRAVWRNKADRQSITALQRAEQAILSLKVGSDGG